MDTVAAQVLAGRTAGPAIEDRLSDQLAAVVATARRRASRGGDRDVDTAHLLHSLLESDPVVRAFLGGGGSLTAKLLGYLAQRSIGYGLRWRRSAEATGAADAGPGAGAGAGALPGWSPAAAMAMEVALDRVRAREARRAEGVDLFAGIVADPECRAAEVLRTAGVDVRGLARGVGRGMAEG
ncbi:Clp protease N-terminal domain-containing protein [Streptomyces sp. WMMB 322]|uniref:Clp protease N-terminal domain-containing protein n=1 Tax=Streptomyces sp. WMMB 322 TaxID=1286821 RepID=UPI000823ED34|nr:Clp protease N-terminal domain-containing protein [Streptomyces sp. WMMB 322]SCK58643.1 Clp amino terminal domain-containing protein, pathogenicity island component [Streptomyces sp. WMMB 322]